MPGTNIPVRTVGRSRLSKRGCICPCNCGALPRFIAGGRVHIKDQHIANAPAWMRDYLIDQSSFIDCIKQCDVCKHWNIPPNLSSGIYSYLNIQPNEYTYKLKLKKAKFAKKFEASNGELLIPATDQELYETISTDEEMEAEKVWIAPEITQAELCIDICRCNGAPVVRAPEMPIMKNAIADIKSAIVHFLPPLKDGNSPITGYQITSIPEGIIKTGVQSPIKIKGLKIGIWYQFIVRARNRRGMGPPSAQSNPIRISNNGFIAELQNILRMEKDINTKNNNSNNKHSIINKTIKEAEDEDLSTIFNDLKGKYKLCMYSMLCSKKEYSKKTFLHKKYTEDNMHTHQKSMIAHSLHKFENNTEKMEILSLECFQYLLIYLGYIKNSKMRHTKSDDSSKYESVFSIIELGTKHINLRDEIYCQIIKQINECPTKGVLLASLFKLLYLCLSVFKCSHELSLIIVSTISEHAKPKGFSSFRSVSEIAAKCYKQWKVLTTVGPANNMLTRKDIKNILDCNSDIIRMEIYLPDDTRLRMKVTPFCIMSELLQIVCTKFGFKGKMSEEFQIKIISNFPTLAIDSNCYHENTEVLHWYGRWREICKQHPLLRYKILLYKWKYNADDKEITEKHKKSYVHFLYHQSRRMVSVGDIQIGISDACMLGAIQTIINNHGEYIQRYSINKQLIADVIPYHLRQKIALNEWCQQLWDDMKSLNNTSNDQKNKEIKSKKEFTELIFYWQKAFLNYLSNNVPMYGASYFEVIFSQPKQYRNEDKKEDQYLVGINWNIFCIAQHMQTNIIQEISIQRIKKLRIDLQTNEITFDVELQSESDTHVCVPFAFQSEHSTDISSILSHHISQNKHNILH